MKRRFDPAEPEWMDRPQPISEELISDLRNLRALNRYFGSYRWSAIFSGAGFCLTTNCASRSRDRFRRHSTNDDRLARRRGARLAIDAVDFQESTVQIARELSADYPEITFHCADIHHFGEERDYDLVLFSLALHHFEEKEATDLLRRCRALSRGKVLVADLRRGWVAKLGVDLLTTTYFREPMTRNDARVSAARAFSFGELDQLAWDAGWGNFGHRRFPFGRQAIWLER